MKKNMKVVIIGGVAAGPKVGSKVARLFPEAEVTMIEKGEFLSYAGCGLPYYMSGVVKEQKELMCTPLGVVRDAVFFRKMKNIRVFNRTEAIKIDRENKSVTVKDLRSQKESVIPYDKLVLATGADPVIPPFKGKELKNVFTLHGVEDAEGMKTVFARGGAKDVVIVGGGLIGVETAEAFSHVGSRVTIVEMLPQILPMLDEDMAYFVRKHLETKGVKVRTETTVKSICGNGVVSYVETDKGNISSDIVILAVGVRPNVHLAKEAGIETGKRGGIKVNAEMQTNDPDIYAAGDCVESWNIITGKPAYVPLGSTANKQGRVAAVNVCGGNEKFPGILGTAVCKVFDFTVARTGLSVREARDEGFDVVTVLSPAPDKAHFYPTAKIIMMKLVVDKKSRRLLGIQAIGPGDASKRVDVAATALSAKMTVDDISNLDLAYAPPYAPAMDNIITAANIAKNKLNGLYNSIMPEEVKEKISKGEDFIFLDVRTPEEYEAVHIENTVLIPLGQLHKRFAELPKDKEIITFCKISLRGYEAALILQAKGFSNVKVMDGGIVMWPYEVVK